MQIYVYVCVYIYIHYCLLTAYNLAFVCLKILQRACSAVGSLRGRQHIYKCDMSFVLVRIHLCTLLVLGGSMILIAIDCSCHRWFLSNFTHGIPSGSGPSPALGSRSCCSMNVFVAASPCRSSHCLASLRFTKLRLGST